jgi:hypothetical protein
MAKPKKQDQEKGEEALIEEMNEGLRRMLNTPPETHDEMIKRRKSKTKSKAAKK